MQLDHLKPESDDPLHDSPQGRLIGHFGAKGRRVRAYADLAVVERILGRVAQRKLPRDPWVTLGLWPETIYQSRRRSTARSIAAERDVTPSFW